MRALGPLLVAGLLTIAVPEASVPLPPRPVPRPVASHVEPAPSAEVLEADFGTASLLVPEDCLPGDGSFDLVVFFHGSPAPLRDALSGSRLHAALLVENVGRLTAAYSDRFPSEAALGVEVDLAVKMVTEHCPLPNRRVRRIALGGWSAGFAAVTRMLSYPKVVERVDAVLLADGLHSALMDVRARTFPPDALVPVEAFARKAIQGDKLLVITHSEIPTREYASTTECADFLLARLGLERADDRGPGPIPGMERLSRVTAGQFVLEGYAGGDERAHGQHLHAVGDTFLRRLRDFWATHPGRGSE